MCFQANQLIDNPGCKLTKKDLGLAPGDKAEFLNENDEAYFLFKIDQIIRNHRKKKEESSVKGKKTQTERQQQDCEEDSSVRGPCRIKENNV